MMRFSTARKVSQLAVGQVVYVRSYNTMRIGVGKIEKLFSREDDGMPMAIVELLHPAYTGWDPPEILDKTPDEAVALQDERVMWEPEEVLLTVAVEVYRLAGVLR